MKNYVITIARGYGSGGRTIGKMLAKELDIHYYDQELLRMASDESVISESLFARADEKLKTPALFKAGRKSAYTGEIIPPEGAAVTLGPYRVFWLRRIKDGDALAVATKEATDKDSNDALVVATAPATSGGARNKQAAKEE